MQKIAVGLPTRGIIDTLTIESVLKNLEGKDYILLFTHDLPLPDSRINVTNRFLESDADYLWWVDDDMVIPDGFLDKMLKVANKETVATGAYYMQNGMKSVYYRDNKDVASQCGFGCALVHRNIIENTPKPWYLTTKKSVRFGTEQRWIEDPNSTWGGEDIWFWHQAIDKAGFKMIEVGDVGHLRIRTWGDKYLNLGVHDIYFLDENGQDGFKVELNRDEWNKAETDYIDSRIKMMDGQPEKADIVQDTLQGIKDAHKVK